MVNYAQIKDDKIIGMCNTTFQNLLNVEVSDEIYNEYLENPNKYIWDGLQVVENPNYEAEQAQKEKERILELFMTRSDFFDGTIMAWGVDENALLPLIQSMVNVMPLDDRLKLKAMNNFKNALNFYRKHDLFNMIVNIPLPLTETLQVTIKEEQLDKFFDEVANGSKETAWQNLPQPELIPIPEPEVPEEPNEVE